jgi:holliday junction DNA helicase RuvA
MYRIIEEISMVDYCVGIVKEVREQEIVLDLGMIALAVQVPQSQSFEKDMQNKVYTHVHWNAEQGPSLYGFVQPLDRSVFRVVISCSGIGPKIALAILGDLGSHSFLHAISTSDDQMLSKVSGIGKKKAEQMIVALKHKVAALIESGVDVGDVKESSHFYDVSQALQSLNYSRQEISRVMDYLKKNTKVNEVSFDHLLRYALSYLSKQM